MGEGWLTGVSLVVSFFLLVLGGVMIEKRLALSRREGLEVRCVLIGRPKAFRVSVRGWNGALSAGLARGSK